MCELTEQANTLNKVLKHISTGCQSLLDSLIGEDAPGAPLKTPGAASKPSQAPAQAVRIAKIVQLAADIEVQDLTAEDHPENESDAEGAAGVVVADCIREEDESMLTSDPVEQELCRLDFTRCCFGQGLLPQMRDLPVFVTPAFTQANHSLCCVQEGDCTAVH